MHNGTFCLLEGSGLIPPETNCTFSKEKKGKVSEEMMHLYHVTSQAFTRLTFHTNVAQNYPKKAKWDTGHSFVDIISVIFSVQMAVNEPCETLKLLLCKANIKHEKMFE